MNSNSVSNKSWIFKNYSEQDVLFYKENFSLDEITSKLLSIRKIKKEDVNTFLSPTIKNSLPNPEILSDIRKSTKRTVEAISKKEKIAIFGDYDVDGASASAFCDFNEIGISNEIYIPDRKKRLRTSEESFKILINEGAS